MPDNAAEKSAVSTAPEGTEIDDAAAQEKARKKAAAKAASLAKLAAKAAAAEADAVSAAKAATDAAANVPVVSQISEATAAKAVVAEANALVQGAVPPAAEASAPVKPAAVVRAAAADAPGKPAAKMISPAPDAETISPDASKPVRYAFPQWWKEWSGLSNDDKLLGAFRAAAVFVLIGIPIFLFSYHPAPDNQPIYAAAPWLHISWTSGRFVWTLVIALLPLAIVLMGFYRWRQICPLAFFGRMSEWLGYPDRRTTPAKDRKRRTMPEWMVKNYPYVTWGFLASMMALRILLINSNAVALAWAFIGLMILAASVSFRYVGKSWCNYLCPVSTIQRIYMETDRPNYPDNSQCPSCSGCKTVPTKGRCPDINSENDYWQEVKSPARAWAYYAWPGTVLGFYTWYFLHKPYYGHELYPALLNAGIYNIRNFEVIPEAHRFGVEMERMPHSNWFAIPVTGTTGTDWAYYMSGDWTRDPAPWKEWLTPGWGFHGMLSFLGWIPTIIAAPLTLFLFSFVSFALFRTAEKLWLPYTQKRHAIDADGALEAVRHTLFCIAGFAGFMLFYTFAGAPTLRQLPFQLYSLFYLGVSVVATTILFNRLRRTRVKAANDKQARDWIDRWPAGVPQFPLAGKTMEEAYNLITLEVRTNESGRSIFKNTVRNMLVDNALTLDDVSLLNKMAKDLGLSESDQKKVITELSKDIPELFDPKLKMSLGDRLRLIGYRSNLEQAMSSAGGALPPASEVLQMQEAFRIQPSEHEEILRDLRNPQGTRAARLREEVSELFSLRHKAAVLAQHTAPAICFLELELRGRIRDDRDHILEVANLYGPADELVGLRDTIRQNTSFDSSNIRNDDNAAAQKALEQAEEWLAVHLPPVLAGDVIQAISAASDELPSINETPSALTESLLAFTDDREPLIRGAAIYALRDPLRDPDLPEDLRQKARAVAVKAAFEDPILLVKNAGVVALAPELWREEEYARLLDSPLQDVRRAVVNRLPMPPPLSLRPQLIQIATGSHDYTEVRVLASALSGDIPRFPRGHIFPTMTRLERVYSLKNGDSLLSNLPKEELLTLGENASEQVFAEGEYLCHEGEIEDVVYFLVDGQTEAVQALGNGTERRLGISRAGETVGEMAVLDPAPRSASVRALGGAVRALGVRGEDFRAVLRRDPNSALGLVRLVIRRNRQATALSSLALTPAA